ncbi:MAG: beta-ketoacyl-[acyl-carrier-protein] synthase family protein [Crocinitomicaceae bacterium]|nr:beta-ketoacyl-[acyl-carrier-protein] synthase family protein [Crocinitomicaceae bacterium]
MLENKVHILDYALVSPIAVGTHHILTNIQKNVHADRPIKRFDASGFPFHHAAEIKEDLTAFYLKEAPQIKEICKFNRLLELLAASYGIAESRIEKLIHLLEPENTGVILGIGADVTPFELFEKEIFDLGDTYKMPMAELFSQLNAGHTKLNHVLNPYDLYAIYLAQKFNACAFQKSILTACVSSTQAIAFAYKSILAGEADVVIAGGTDSLLNGLAMISFGKLGVINETTKEPTCKPFDVMRNGALAGECAGFTILASDEFVKKNKLIPKGQLMGFGNTLDAFKITAPDPEGNSITEAIRMALESSNLNPNQINYINAHGTGTKHNDHLELKCLRKVFGDDLKNIPVSSTKSRHGHAIAAAGIQEFCLVMELMHANLVPGNLFLKTPCDTELNLPKENVNHKIDYAMTNNFAFGGVNTVLVLKKHSNES